MGSGERVSGRVFAVLGLVGAIAGCGAAEDPNEIVSRSSALLQNSPYLRNQMLQARSGSGAGATIFQGKAFYSYVRGADGHIGIVIDTDLSNGGGQNGSTYTLSDTSNYGAALFPFGGVLDLFYVGNDQNIYIRQSSDGVNWGPTIQLVNGNNWYFIPSPASLNGHLSLFAIESSQHQINEISVSGTQLVGEIIPVNNAGPTNRGVTTATWNGQVYLSWAGTDSNNTIHIVHTNVLGGVDTWSPSTALVDGGFPSLIALTNQTMELVFRGNDSHIYRTYTSDGVSFGAPTRDNASTTNQKPMAFMPQGASDAWVYYIGVNNGLYAALE